MFFNDCDKRVKAIAALQYMKVHHITPLSKVPHFDGADFVRSIAPDSKEEVGSEVRTESDMKQRVGEADDDYLVRTCRLVVIVIPLSSDQSLSWQLNNIDIAKRVKNLGN